MGVRVGGGEACIEDGVEIRDVFNQSPRIIFDQI